MLLSFVLIVYFLLNASEDHFIAEFYSIGIYFESWDLEACFSEKINSREDKSRKKSVASMSQIGILKLFVKYAFFLQGVKKWESCHKLY